MVRNLQQVLQRKKTITENGRRFLMNFALTVVENEYRLYKSEKDFE